MGKSLADLGLKKGTAEGVDYDHIPDERGGGFIVPPYPADYVFKLPGDMNTVWDVFEDGEGKQWVSTVFDDDNPLVITTAKDPAVVGTNLHVRINNKPRVRSKKENISVSDMVYLIRVLDPTARPGAGVKDQAKLNEAFVAEMKKHAGKEFLAAEVWTANCSPKRDAYFPVVDPQTGQQTTATEKHENPDAPGSFVQGCDKRYYMGDWPKDESGRYYDSRMCTCGAVLRPFPSLERYRAVTK
jgi:hypothetical protein